MVLQFAYHICGLQICTVCIPRDEAKHGTERVWNLITIESTKLSPDVPIFYGYLVCALVKSYSMYLMAIIIYCIIIYITVIQYIYVYISYYVNSLTQFTSLASFAASFASTKYKHKNSFSRFAPCSWVTGRIASRVSSFGYPGYPGYQRAMANGHVVKGLEAGLTAIFHCEVVALMFLMSGLKLSGCFIGNVTWSGQFLFILKKICVLSSKHVKNLRKQNDKDQRNGFSTICSHLACALLVSQLSQLYRSRCYCEQQDAKIWKNTSCWFSVIL